MALSNLLAGLEAEAAEEAARVEAETREEADRIVEAARAEARALQEQAARAGESELRREAEQRRARARLEAAAILREAREEAFQGFLAELRAQLASLRERGDYPAVMGALIREGLAALPAATILRVDPRDERLAGELLGELGAELQIEAALDTAGGVAVATRDGRAARNTIEERLANAEPALRLLLGDLLGGRAPAEPERAEVR
jgi:vacuolar-type H+-ATPase subunit E/Vma4